jgi:hypothetical protein
MPEAVLMVPALKIDLVTYNPTLIPRVIDTVYRSRSILRSQFSRWVGLAIKEVAYMRVTLNDGR